MLFSNVLKSGLVELGFGECGGPVNSLENKSAGSNGLEVEPVAGGRTRKSLNFGSV